MERKLKNRKRGGAEGGGGGVCLIERLGTTTIEDKERIEYF